MNEEELKNIREKIAQMLKDFHAEGEIHDGLGDTLEELEDFTSKARIAHEDSAMSIKALIQSLEEIDDKVHELEKWD